MPVSTARKKQRFQKEYEALSAALRAEVDSALEDLFKNPIPLGRRFHSLQGYRNPKLYTIDATSNKAYKISLELEGEVATLRRIATHKEIDRAP